VGQDCKRIGRIARNVVPQFSKFNRFIQPLAMENSSPVLKSIIIRFPAPRPEFAAAFLSVLNPLGRHDGNLFSFKSSNPEFIPQISLNFETPSSGVLTSFIFSTGETISVSVENSTGMDKSSPHAYQLIKLSEVNRRLSDSGIKIIEIDHVGFNLPWFSSGLHPEIINLRQYLSSRCLYHRYPTGEPWDFILPADEQEITGHKEVDYSVVRKPKFELVSFEKASTPLVQFDLSVNAGFEKFSELFPEALIDPEFKNVWVYLDNPYQVDVCLVINEHGANDWSNYFKGDRIQSNTRTSKL
jgi:hypothetical protein